MNTWPVIIICSVSEVLLIIAYGQGFTGFGTYTVLSLILLSWAFLDKFYEGWPRLNWIKRVFKTRR